MTIAIIIILSIIVIAQNVKISHLEDSCNDLQEQDDYAWRRLKWYETRSVGSHGESVKE